MIWQKVFFLCGLLCLFLGLSMLPCAIMDWIRHRSAADTFLISIGLSLTVGGLMVAGCRHVDRSHLNQREGIAIVSVGWILVSFFGALPFHFSGAFSSFTDAVFESVSGFTTTGSSVLSDIEALSPGLLMWRSVIQWFGGMGIIVLSIAILPFLHAGGMQLFKAEVPSPAPDKLKPRIRDTAMILWKVYVGFTVAQVVLLMLGGMSLFDAMCHAFTTMPTGGFSTKNTSIAFFDQAYTDVLIIVFMVFAGINFSLHYQFLQGKRLAFWKDTECRIFLFLVVGLSLIVSLDIHGQVVHSLGQAIRLGAFQVVSILTTTGYATADYQQWPPLSQLILFGCMFVGACAGSTGGGMKLIRLVVCFKLAFRELNRLLHPHGVFQLRIDGKTVSDTMARSILGFLILYVGLWVLASALLTLMNVDLMSSCSAVAACLGNIGPGFAAVGPTQNFAALPVMAKWVLTFCMLLGRLEIYTLFVMFVPEFWRK